MTSRDCHAPTMIWNIALGWHGFMSGVLQADVGPFLAWWYAGPSASSRLWSAESRASLPRISNPGIISAGTSCVPNCSSVRKPADDSCASVKILPPIWRLWKLNYSGEVCHSANFPGWQTHLDRKRILGEEERRIGKRDGP